MRKLDLALVSALALAAASARGQVSVTPAASVAMYPSTSTNLTVVLDADWQPVAQPTVTGGITASLDNLTAGPRNAVLTLTSGAADGTAVITATNAVAGGDAFTATVTVTLRARPAITGLALATAHNGHLHSAPVEPSMLAGALTGSNLSLTAASGNTALFTVAPATATTLNGITVTPVANANGTTNLTVVARDTVLGGAVTNTLSVSVRPALIVSNLSTNRLTFAEDTSSNITFRVDTCHPFAASACTYTFTEPYGPAHNIIASNNTTLAVAGGVTNLTTTFVPNPNAYGVVTARLDIAVGTAPRYTFTTNIVITVTPVPDAPIIRDLPSSVTISNHDAWTNAVFAGASITDPDDFPPPPPDSRCKETLRVVVTNAEQSVVFNGIEASAAVTPALSNTLEQTAWLRAVSLKARDGLLGLIGSANAYNVHVIATGTDGLACTNTVSVRVEFRNTPPDFDVRLTDNQVTEGQPTKPFFLNSLYDPDIGQTHTLTARLAPGAIPFGSLTFNGATGNSALVYTDGNQTTLDSALRNLQFNAFDGVTTNATETVYVIFEMFDGHDTSVRSNALVITQLRRSPSVTLGGVLGPFAITSDLTAPPMRPFPLAAVTDPDEGGNQPVRADVTIVPPFLKRTDVSSIATLQHPTELSALLRAVTLVPDLDPGSPLSDVAIGQTVAATVSVTATDKTGLSSQTRSVIFNIERRNAAPVITVPADQPVLFTPGATIRPFEGIGLWNDDTNAVKFTFTVDTPSKGAFGNTAGLSPSGNGFTITAAVPGILAIVTNVTFTLNALYPFPPDDPGGTTFTLSAQDFAMASSSKALSILVQSPPRNWLVTRPVDDGTPGTLSHALNNFGNNDVITFALDEYPATLRLPDAGALNVTAAKALTIKGPGADLLTLSGDTNGDGHPDRAFMTVAAPVTLEGLTLADCAGGFGGALSVIENGHLTLRHVTLRNCLATDAGGAIDVDHGRLTVESSLFMDNATGEDALYGGGAVSLYTDAPITFRNTVFLRNRQGCVNGAGGGAINAEFPGDSNWFLDVDVIHCSFIDNADDATWDIDVQATSILANRGSAFYLHNNIFADDPLTRSLATINAAEVTSYGGNVCDDNATVFLNQGGGVPQKTLLNHPTDLLEADLLFSDALAPLNLTPQDLVHAEAPTDFTGRIRNAVQTTRGAVDAAAAAFPAITEIQLAEGAFDRFIEIYAPLGAQTPVNLHGMTLLVNGAPVHTFGQGTIANPVGSALFTAGTAAAAVPAAHTFPAGKGVVIAFPRDPAGTAAFQQPMTPDNPTPVVRASIVSNALDFARLFTGTGRGSVAITAPGSTLPVLRHTFLTAYNDPGSALGTNLLATGAQSIATLPQARGFAFVPHTWEDSLYDDESPGRDSGGTPFGSDYPPPTARPDALTATEDDAVLIDVLANDYDLAGEPLTIVDFSALSALGAAVSLDPATGKLLYDPTANGTIQALPAGRELLDTFTYTIWAGREIPLTANAAVAGAGPYTVTCATADDHGLSADRAVWIAGRRLELTAVPDARHFTFVTDDAALIADPALTNGAASTRNPAFTATATVTLTLDGLNDNPTGVDDLLAASLTERDAVRLLAHPDLSATAVFSEYPQTPVPGLGLLANDTDADEGDAPATFRITGILADADVHPVTAAAPSPLDPNATRITSPGHGLASGAAVTLVGIRNPARLNGARTVTAIDADTFDIPVAPGVILLGRAFWIPTPTAQAATSARGASVTLLTRANPLEDSIVYDASASAQLRTLADGESAVDGFWYALADRYNAPGLAYVSLRVHGVNDAPTVTDGPPALDGLPGAFGGGDAITLLTNRITVLTVLTPPESGLPGRADLIVADKGLPALTTADLLLLRDFYATDERTPLAIDAAELLLRATDIDTTDTLSIPGAAPASHLGAAVSVAAGLVTYDPRASATLQALGIGETAFDVFTVNVSDGLAATPMRVAVLVRGVNNTPTASPVYVYNPGALPTVAFTPAASDVDARDLLTLVTPASTNVTVPNPALPTNAIPYAVTDHSLFLAADDTFRMAPNAPATTLDVLANDINLHNTGIALQSVTPSLRGGTVAVNPARTALLYTPPAGFAGTDLFTYAATNALGIARRANVRVHIVLNDYNGPLHACADEYAVARGMALDMPVTANDTLLPNAPAGLTVDPAYNADWPAGLTLSGNTFRYASTAADPSAVTFTYRVLGGGGAAATATVLIKIIDRVTGIQPDHLTAAPGAAPVTLDLLANDIILGDTTDGMIITALGTAATAGAVTIAPGATNVTYAAPAGFIGVDTFTYTAVDRYGAVGTTNVTVTVGVPAATPDNITVATNTATLINVLANDTVRPYAPPASLTLTDVAPRPGQTPNGTATVSNNMVHFTAGPGINASAIWRYTYTAPGAALAVTGEVTIVTSHTETLYASADNFMIRKGAPGATLDVLANDRSYRAIQYPLTIQSVTPVTWRNGTVTTDGTTVTYTPDPAFEGEDTFSYIVSDGTGTATGFVTVYVVPGDLIANDDAFIIGYEWDGTAGAAKAYTLPVLLNDAVFPGGNAAISITSVNPALPGATATITPDGKSVIFRPGDYPGSHPGNEYTEALTYEVMDTYGRKQAARVTVTVRLRASAIQMVTQDDAFNVERNSVGNVLRVTANDLVEPKTPLPPAGLHVTASAMYGSVTVSGIDLLYTPPTGFVGIDTATYTISDGLGGTGTATVRVFVGALPAAPDLFSVLRGTTNRLDVLANDPLTQGYLPAYASALSRAYGATQGGTVSIDGTQVIYAPDPSHPGPYPYTEQFTYELSDDTGRLTTGHVTVTVHDLAGSLAASTLYVINADGGGILPGSPRDLWNRRHFGDGYLLDPAADGNADPDADGLTNDAEYAFGGDPNVPDPGAARLNITLRPDGTADLTYTRRANDPTLVFLLLACDDLTVRDWQPVTGDTLTFIAHPTDTELTIATHNLPVPSTPKQRFFKVQAL